VADCLSRYYENDTEEDRHAYDEFVNADVRFDPEGEKLPIERREEVRQGNRPSPERLEARRVVLKDGEEDRTREARELRENEEDPSPIIPEEDVVPLPDRMKRNERFLDFVCAGYKSDAVFSKVLKDPRAYSTFRVADGLILRNNTAGAEVLCIPRAPMESQSVVGVVIDNAHTTLGHFGHRKTADYIR
jgi:hypothetical protein